MFFLNGILIIKNIIVKVKQQQKSKVCQTVTSQGQVTLSAFTLIRLCGVSIASHSG